MAWRKFSIILLLILLLSTWGRCRTLKANNTVVDSMSSEAFFKMTPTEQQNTFYSAVKQRLQLFENIKYMTSVMVYNIKGGSAFPYGGPIAPPVSEQNRLIDTRASSRLNGAYKTETERNNSGKADLRINTTNAYDASLGEFRATSTAIHDGTKNNKMHAAIDTKKDIIDKEDRLSYWGPGQTDPRGVFFLEDSLLALEKLKNSSHGSTPSEVLIAAGKVGEIKTIALTFQSVISNQVNTSGTITVEFDPKRQFLPIAFCLKRKSGTGENQKWLWFEAMLVLDAARVDGVWFPTRYQLVQANQPLAASNKSPLYDVRIRSIEFGSVTPDDVKLIFPTGTRVVDRIREVAFISDGRGGVQDGKIKSIAQLDLSGAAAKVDSVGFNGFSLLLLNLGVLLIFCGVFLVRRRIRLNAKKGD